MTYNRTRNSIEGRARSMTFEIYSQRDVAQFFDEGNLLMVGEIYLEKKFISLGRSSLLAIGGKSRMLGQASRSRHFPTSFCRNGHAWAGQTRLVSPTLDVPGEFDGKRETPEIASEETMMYQPH